MNKQLQLLSYQYPSTIKLRVDSQIYTYESSEFFCRKFLECYNHGGRFRTLNWFKGVSECRRER